MISFCLLTGHGQITSAVVKLGDWLYQRSQDEGLRFQSQGHPVWENSSFGIFLEKVSFFFKSFAQHGSAVGFISSYIAFAALSVSFFVLSYSRHQRLVPAVASAGAGVLIGFLQAWFQNRHAQWGHEFLPWLYAGAATALIALIALGILAYGYFVQIK